MTRDDPPTLPFYTEPGPMTSPGRYAHLLEGLPSGIADLTAVGHGLLVHEHLAGAYGVTLSDEDRESVHDREVEQTLARFAARDDRPLDVAREPTRRVAGNCRHFTVLMVTLLRAQGVPARARCGFGGYFREGLFEDHWVCEYWDAGAKRWKLVDAQIDDRQREMLGIDFDLTDVSGDGFLTGGDAWRRCRAGSADPATFGLSTINEAGDWWIAGNLMRDAAALRNLELLPWDSWGAMPAPFQEIGDKLCDLFDRLAELTEDPDASFADLAELCRDDRLVVPPTVHNDLRNRDEAVPRQAWCADAANALSP